MNPVPALLTTAALAALAPAQVVNVNNTGCPGAGHPTHNNTARLGQTFTFSYACGAGNPALAGLGLQSGGGLIFSPPLVCGTSPCNWYVAQPVTLPFMTGTGSWSIPIPNDVSFLFSTWSVQVACLDSGRSCVLLSGALSFAIGP